MAFSHLDEAGRLRMVDVSHKPDQARMAVAEGAIELAPTTVEAIRERHIAKGEVLAAARLAGIQAAKRTGEIIPLCHTLPLTHVDVEFEIQETSIAATALAKSVGKTGVEMEALTAVSAALLTIYDMCKAVDKGMVLSGIRLVSKEKKELGIGDEGSGIRDWCGKAQV
jgi:cyclic pyranopterin monophosphate synthase